MDKKILGVIIAVIVIAIVGAAFFMGGSSTPTRADN